MKAIKIHESDNVAVVLQPVKRGSEIEVDGRVLLARDDIPVGHKIALQDIRTQGEIRKYSKVIGLASSDILEGQHVHCHNVEDITERLCNEFEQAFRKAGEDN